MNLRDKRNELYELHKNIIPSSFMLLIEKQDEEAVKELKDRLPLRDIRDAINTKDLIDEIFGEKPT